MSLSLPIIAPAPVEWGPPLWPHLTFVSPHRPWGLQLQQMNWSIGHTHSIIGLGASSRPLGLIFSFSGPIPDLIPDFRIKDCRCFHNLSRHLKKKKDFVCLFLERENEGEEHQCVVASYMSPTGDLASTPDRYPRLGLKPVTLWFAGQHSVH